MPPQSVAVAYRREVFETVGLFDESFDACEDVEFNHRVARAGLRCFFTPRVGVRYHPRATLAGLFRQMARYGRGRVRLLRKHPDTFSLPGFLPAAFLFGLVAGAAAGLCHRRCWRLAYAGALAAVRPGRCCCSASPCASAAATRRCCRWLPLVFAAIHAGAGWGVLCEAVAGRKPARPAPMLPAASARRAA